MEKPPLKETVFENILRFLNIDLWVYPLKNAKGFHLIFLKSVRTFYISVKGFLKEMCFLRASALTFYTIMSLVPVLAMLFAIARGFGYQTHLEKEIYSRFSDQKEIIDEVIRFVHNLLNQTRSGLLAGIGIVILFWSVLKVLHHVERSFNTIWKVRKNRPLHRKFSDFLALIIITPIFFVLASSFTLFIVSKLKGYIQALELYETVSSFLLFSIKLFPYCLIWILFSFLYLFIPNTKVRFTSGVIAGVIAGTIYQLLQWGYLFFQIGAARYNAIYGSFAAFPLFLLWVYVSWLIVLFGAEISYGYQNVEKYEYGWKVIKWNRHLKVLLSLWIVHKAISRFRKKESPLTKSQIFQELEISYFLIEKVIDELVDVKVLISIESKKTENLYMIGVPFEDLRIKEVIDLIDYQGIAIPEIQSSSFHEMNHILQSFKDLVAKSEKNIRIQDIL